MRYFLAIIPSVILLAYIYKKDKKEKEPVILLLRCFIFGAISIIPTLIAETSGMWFLNLLFRGPGIFKTIIENYIVVGLVEEGAKLFFLFLLVDKSKEFDCMFDGVVYAVFMSLGFATFENIGYVADGGISTAITRMVTAIPGHMCFAVFMGYFYSRYKLGQKRGNAEAAGKFGLLTLGVPAFIHGTYDCLLSFDGEGLMAVFAGLMYLLWIVLVAVMFMVSFRLVNKASREDRYIE